MTKQTEPMSQDETKLKAIVIELVKFCNENEISEEEAYMAMTYITKAMEDTLGFRHKERADA